MREKGIESVIVHPRYGLDVEYLSDQWFEIFGWCVREAKRLGMRIWIYDELNWPSGTAGMTIQKADPNFQSKYLCVEASPLSEIDFDSFRPGKYMIAANIEGAAVTKTRVIEEATHLKTLTGNWQVFNCTLKYDPFYIDTLSREAVDCFKRVTYDEYYKRFGDEFGETITAAFTDEPSIYWVSVGYDDWNLPHTDDLFETFEERFGYCPIEKIPYLFYRGGTAFRADFWDHAGRLFNERYHANLSGWCREHGLIYTGHNNNEEPLRYQIRFQGNMFDTMRAMDIPGVDHLGKATLGNWYNSIIGHKICSSVAHISGKPRCMSESFGVMDWDTTFANLKRVTDWQYALGIDLLVPHALYHTISGPTKRESPPSFFYQSPHWDDFDYFIEYVRRLETLLTGGRHVCKTAVMYPLSGLWASYQPDRKTSDFEHTDNFLNSLCLELVKNQIDFDLLDYRALTEATLEDGKIKLADEEYQVLVVPTTSYMRPAEVIRLTEISKSGVNTTLFHKSMEPLPQNLPDTMNGASFVRSEELVGFVEILKKQIGDDIQITGGGSDDIMAYRREKDGRKITFLLNRSDKHRKVMAMIKDYPAPAILDPETGAYTAITGRRAGTRTQVELRFQPNQSYFLVSGVADAPARKQNEGEPVSIEIRDLAVEPPINVASIYRFNYSAHGKEPVDVDIRTNPRYIPVNWDPNPTSFEEHAGTYDAAISIEYDPLPEPEACSLILDADYAGCEVYINGTRVGLQPATPDMYLTDYEDLHARVGHLLKRGKNVLRVISPTKLSEPPRLVGDFRVHIAGNLLVLAAPGELNPFALEMDFPFYSGTIIYTACFDLDREYSALILNLHDIHDSAAIYVNGRLAGRRLWGPYEFDITDASSVGANTVRIEVRNNAANLIQGSPRPLGLRKPPGIAAFE